MTYTINRNGQAFGPYTLDQLRRYMSEGWISLNDLACVNGDQKWVPLHRLLNSGPPPSLKTPSAPETPFSKILVASTPTAFVTPVLIVINAIVFVLMIIGGLSPMEPTTESLIQWGADFGPLTMNGQWWRVISSTFVHIGIIHIVLNMYVLFSIGEFTERIFGNFGFTVLYLLAGVGGGLASLLFHPQIVSAGASGAIFGLYGGLLAFLLVQRHAIPTKTLKSLTTSTGGFLLYNVVYGAIQPRIDMSAHIGGLTAGFFMGLVLAQPLSQAKAGSRAVRGILALVLGSAAAVACALHLPTVNGTASPEASAPSAPPASTKSEVGLTAPLSPAQAHVQISDEYYPEDTLRTRREYSAVVGRSDGNEVAFVITRYVDGMKDINGKQYYREIAETSGSATNPPTKVQYSRWDGVGVHNIDGEAVGAEYLDAAFPLAVGSEWVSQGATFRAVGLQDIQIGDRTFEKCLVVKVFDESGEAGVEYFAQGIGLVKMVQIDKSAPGGVKLTLALSKYEQ